MCCFLKRYVAFWKSSFFFFKCLKIGVRLSVLVYVLGLDFWPPIFACYNYPQSSKFDLQKLFPWFYLVTLCCLCLYCLFVILWDVT